MVSDLTGFQGNANIRFVDKRCDGKLMLPTKVNS